MSGALYRSLAILCAGLAMIALPGCLGQDGDDRARHVPAPPADAKRVDVGWLRTARGHVDYCTDASSPARTEAVDRFNREFKGRGLEAEIQRLPRGSREQREKFLHRSLSCDVYDSDVVWMAEWAARGRVYNMRPYIEQVERRGRTFIPSTLKTAEFASSYWGVPHTTNAGFLYYRKDVVSRPERATWQAVYRSAKANGGIFYQGAPPEPLTVNFLEIAFAAGGRVLSRDGSRSVIDSQENLDALRFMVDGIGNGAAPADVLNQDEDATEASFRNGATFMRNWPDKFNKLAGTPIKYAVAPLPIFDGAGVAGVLGGADLVIDAGARNPRGALALIDFLIRPQQQKDGLIRHSEPAVLAQTYSDPDVKDRRGPVPFADELFRAIRQGRPRPLSPVYYKISDAISKHVHDALSRRVSPEQALEQANAEIEKALASAAER